ncbi:MAG TPA: YdeI family protein [Geothrix sp.]|nr:YdeI family protein [Geothrix sp.]
MPKPAKGRTNPEVDFFFEKAGPWQEAYKALRRIMLGMPLTEDLKWGVPCYTLENKNVVLIHGFKEYCAVLFHKGVLLKDPQGVLITQTENVQAARQIRFTDVREVREMEDLLKAYVQEAIDAEIAGLKVTYKKPSEFAFPEELITKLETVPGLQDAFDALTPGRQRAYILHFSAPKQSKTRTSRIEKCTERILQGKGLDD